MKKVDVQRRQFLGAAAAYTAVVACGSTASAAGFPTRPVTVVLPYAAGGATDSLLRSMQPSLSETLGQAVVIENKPGASGLLGAIQMMKVPPDGYSLSLIPEAAFRIPQLQKTAFDPLKDFTYIIRLAGYAFGLAVRADAPWRTWNELVADAKRNPGKISFGSAGPNSTMHFTMEEIMEKAGIRLNHIPYKGEADVVNALLGGHVDIAIASGPLTPHTASGRLRVLMTWTPSAISRYPNVPTLRDAGYDMVSMAPFGLVGPKGMNPATVKVLHDAFRKALDGPEGSTALRRVELENAYLNSNAYGAYARDEFERQRNLIKRLESRASN